MKVIGLAMEAFVLVQAHRAQSGSDGPSARGEDRADQKQLGVLPDSLGEEWREGGQHLYHRGR